MESPQIVVDTNVLVAGLRSKRGASNRLLRLVGTGTFEIHLSVPLFFEYAEQCLDLVGGLPLSKEDVDDLLDYLCKVAHHWPIFFLWRPFLNDPKDDLVLEVAVAGQCDGIVTFNKRDFLGAHQFGLKLWTPKEFLQQIGEVP
jgi:putative PIN family toxin of toxin-antitoxin system